MLTRRLSPLEWSLLLLAALPIGVLILFVARYGYTVPWLDEYTKVVPLILMQQDGTLTLASLFDQIGDHRVPLPYAISVLFTILNGGDSRWELAFSIVIMLVSLGLLYDLYRRQAASRLEALVFLVPATFLLFSLGQRENWIWGHQKCMFLLMLGTYLSSWAQGRFPGSTRALWVCVAGTLTAAWSFLSGSVLWGVIPIALWLNGYRRWTSYLIWFVIAGISTVIYLSGFAPNTADRESWRWVFGADEVRFLLVYLGNALTGQTIHLLFTFNGASGWFQPLLPLLMGLLGVVLVATNLVLALRVRRASVRDLSPWLLLIGFSLANGLLLTIGRGGELTGALVARYITVAIPFWLGVIALTIGNMNYLLQHRTRLPRWRRGIFAFMGAASILLVLGYVTNTQRALEMWETHNAVMEQCLLTHLEADPRCRETHFFHNSWTSQEEVLVLLEQLETQRLFLFRTAAHVEAGP